MVPKIGTYERLITISSRQDYTPEELKKIGAFLGVLLGILYDTASPPVMVANCHDDLYGESVSIVTSHYGVPPSARGGSDTDS